MSGDRTHNRRAYGHTLVPLRGDDEFSSNDLIKWKLNEFDSKVM